MAENKMKEVAKLLGIELGVPFDIRVNSERLLGYNPYTFRDNGLYDKDNDCCDVILINLLSGIFEIEQLILDDIEKRYLDGVLRPFKDRVMWVKKVDADEEQFISICIKDGQRIYFPYFNKGTMYKGMKLNKKYTLEELGLFKD